MKTELADRNLCTGCGVCSKVCPQNCITMVEDEFGFRYPKINSKLCLNCNACRKNCVILNSEMKFSLPSLGQYAAYIKDQKLLSKATSGGVLSLISKKIIQSGGYVSGACFNEYMSVEHIITKDIDQLDLLVGSKYVQSNIENVLTPIKTIIEKKQNVLFIGTPCQVAAVKRFVGESGFLYTAEFLCHGVPSPGLWKKYVDYIERKYRSRLLSYNFRSKQHGWGTILVKAVFQNGKQFLERGDMNLFHSWFGKHFSLRSSCFNCCFRTEERCADITVADFWGIEKYYSNISKKQGISAIVINSKKGMEMFQNIEKNNEIVSVSVSRDSIWQDRKTAFSNFEEPEGRKAFMDNAIHKSFDELCNLYPPKKYYNIIMEKIKSIIERR